MYKGDEKMGVAANIISAVLKSVVGDKIGNELANELIGISIDEASEKGIDKISDFINGEKSKIERILSKENMKSMGIPKESIDYVVEEIKDLFSRINITDEVFRQCEYDSTKLSIFLWNEYHKDKGSYIECENGIKCCLFKIAQVLIELLRESEDFEKDFLIQISNSVDDANAEIQKISEYLKDNFNKLDADNRIIFEILRMILEMNKKDGAESKDKKQKVKSRTQEYADKWNQNMFLNDFDEWDEKAGVNVKLKDVYLEDHLSDFIWGENEKLSTNLRRFLGKYVYEKDDNKMLLVLGQPGIGKSTLITWITANFIDRIDEILVYKFASDLGDIDWEETRLSYRILEKLGFIYNDLNGKTLILDGLDEVSISNRMEVLNSLYDNLIYEKHTEKFSLIITCRENYVQEIDRVMGNYIILQPWNEKQIRSFCKIFQKKTNNIISETTVEKLLESSKILGIPLILYMVLALNISIEKEGSIVDVYDRIFSLQGGIYDRCIDNKYFADKHRIGEIKKQIHQISRDIAIWMFENNSEEANITQREYQKICSNVMKEQEKKENIEQDFLIGNYFKLVKHCEGIETEKLCFIHRSIYEYFVAEAICNSIEKAIIDLTEKSQKDLAKNIAFYLKEGKISPTIGKYLQHKIIKFYKKMDDEKKQRFYLWWESTVDKMMDTGMFYYTNRNIHEYKDIIEKEINCFSNLMDILRLILVITDRKYIMESVNTSRLVGYITLKKQWHNLNKVYLENADLRGAKLHEFNLQEANLCDADLEGADLEGADLCRAKLCRANLRGMKLRNTKLKGADLRDADLTGAQLQFAQLESANLSKTLLKNANLLGANVRSVDLTDADLTGAVLDRSEWNASDIKKIFPQLKLTEFIFIVVENSRNGGIYKNELFPETNSPNGDGSSLAFNSELRHDLEQIGIDLLDFYMMHDDEKIKVLEDAGFDLVDYNIFRE